jgi:hypothetical protein
VTWNEAGGTVSRAFADWRRADEENRAFLRLSAKWSADAYDQEWKHAEEAFSRAFDPDRHYGDEHVGLFEEAVGGLWPDAYAWMVEAAALKNGVTTYETYLEKALQEIANGYSVTVDDRKGRLRLSTPKGYESPGWPTLVRAHSVLGNTVDTADIRWARDLRHLLTHQNGELRTEESLEKYRDEGGESSAEWRDPSYVGERVRLGGPMIFKTLDRIAAVVCGVDPAIWEYIWGPKSRQVPLVELYQAKCLVFIPELTSQIHGRSERISRAGAECSRSSCPLSPAKRVRGSRIP